MLAHFKVSRKSQVLY